MKDDKLYLTHIQECIARIEEYTKEGKENFLEDYKTRDAVLRNLQTLAESTQRISPTLKSKYTAIDWENISAFRNVLVHDYLGVDSSEIWDIVAEDIPPLKKTIEQMLRD